jgi:hypothetical protein
MARARELIFVVLVGLWVVTPTPGWAASILPPSADARIISIFPDTNYGRGDLLSVFFAPAHTQYTLMAFDLGSLPANQTVASATLTLYSRLDDGGNPNARPMFILRLVQPWVESEVSWNERSTGISWTNPDPQFGAKWDAVGTTGVAADTDNAYATSYANPQASDLPVVWDMTTLVSEWHNGTYLNYGLWLGADTTGNSLTFRSEDYAVPQFRPVLEVVMVPEPGTLLLVSAGLVLLLGVRRTRSG